jgi:hypothetical protein
MEATERTIIKFELTEKEIKKAIAEYLGRHQPTLLNEVVDEKDVYIITDGELKTTAVFETARTKKLEVKKV